MAREIKSFPFEMKLNAANRTVTGYASTFGNKDLVGDVVQEGAFKKTISERADKIKLLWQHYEPLGKPLRMAEDSKGLHVEAYISKTALGNDALALLEDNVIDSFSIGYDVLQDEYDSQQQTRFLKELKLYEFSLVTFPANEEAGVMGVKNYEDFANILRKTGAADVTRLLKEGRKLSNANRQLIENAIEALTNVLAIAEPLDNTGKSTPKNVNEPLKIDSLNDLEAKELAEILANFKTIN